jgi:hypothetical protein
MPTSFAMVSAMVVPERKWPFFKKLMSGNCE